MIFDLRYLFPGIEDIKERISSIYGIHDRDIFSRGIEMRFKEDGSITYIARKSLNASIAMIDIGVTQKINIKFSTPVNLL